MPFNYGTAGSIRDPRMAYAPRQVDGVTAYWQANPGRMVDTQTGMPLSERLAMIRGQQPPQRDYVYGDSYGQIQGQEQAIEQANFNRALALEQLRRQDQARMEDKQYRNAALQESRATRLANALNEARRFDIGRNMDERRLALERDKERRYGEEFKTKEDNDLLLKKMDIARRGFERDEDISTAGTRVSKMLSTLLPQHAMAEKAFKDAQEEDAIVQKQIADAISSGVIAPNPLNPAFWAPSGKSENQRAAEIAAIANERRLSGNKSPKLEKAAYTAQELFNSIEDLNKSMEKYGFYLGDNGSSLIAGNRKFPINLPKTSLPQPVQPRAADPVDPQWLIDKRNQYARPGQSAISQYGGRLTPSK